MWVWDRNELPTDTPKEIGEMIAKKEAKDRKDADTKARVRASTPLCLAFFADDSLSPNTRRGNIRFFLVASFKIR